MLNLPAAVWNEIARTQTLRSTFGKRWFPMDQDEITAAHERMVSELERRGNDLAVALAYLELAPLLAEREAIQAYVDQHPIHREALREILEVNEALLIAIEEHNLTESQVKQLRPLLAAL
jgi:hypothetical protein